MGLIRGSQFADAPPRAIVEDLGDLARRAEVMRSAALAEAERILAEAKAERDRIIAGAEEVGFEQGRVSGHAEGLAAGTEEGKTSAIESQSEIIAATTEAWQAALAEFAAEREKWLDQAVDDALGLALVIAEKVVKRGIASDPSSVADQMRAVLERVIAGSSLVVRVHPDDEPAARSSLEALAAEIDAAKHAALETDAGLSRGSCVARTAEGFAIDASIETQLERIADAVLGRESNGDATAAKDSP